MPDKAIISQHIDAMDVRPVDDQLRRRAALNVCTVMGRQGRSVDQIRCVLEALGLKRLPPDSW
jgi:predicted RNA-binding protein YlqC (UPF0109 family)